MSEDSAQDLMDQIERKADKRYQRNFIARMEHKLHNKERTGRYRS